ncbi:hypothetical protein OC861_000854 [Tilletia horrida]|nr:hypothetical protein OC845_005876 [Tilletia horrida]KAK0569481.1 hypothetical protein OC861_000854 [Tilletia horrida]
MDHGKTQEQLLQELQAIRTEVHSLLKQYYQSRNALPATEFPVSVSSVRRVPISKYREVKARSASETLPDTRTRRLSVDTSVTLPFEGIQSNGRPKLPTMMSNACLEERPAWHKRLSRAFNVPRAERKAHTSPPPPVPSSRHVLTRSCSRITASNMRHRHSEAFLSSSPHLPIAERFCSQPSSTDSVATIKAKLKDESEPGDVSSDLSDDSCSSQISFQIIPMHNLLPSAPPQRFL